MAEPTLEPTTPRLALAETTLPLIELDEAALTFHVRRGGRISFKQYLLDGLFRRTKCELVGVKALDGVSLRLGAGDRLGIIGGNGAGKTTLLRVIAGIYPTTKGRCVVRGRVASLLSLTLGFEHDATGWENMFYRGYLQGETPASIRAKTAAIAEFSELGEHLNRPVRQYSAGMLVRLAFSIATSIEPDILVIDEVLGAGDHAFQAKARRRMMDLISSSRAVVLASHDLASLTEICNRLLWLEQGRVVMLGPPEEVAPAFQQHQAELAALAAA